MKKLVVIILAFGLLVGGAYVLYNQLGNEVKPQQLVIQGGENPKEPVSTGGNGTGNQTAQNDPVGNDSSKEENAHTAPDFTVYDKDGNPVRLSDFRGKPVVLNVWASWCGPCRSEMPDFNEKYLELKDEVHFLMVNVTGSDNKQDAQAYINQMGFDFPVLFDMESSAAVAYGIHSFPTTYFIDAKGNAVAYAAGALDKATLQQGIDMIR